MLFFKLSVVIKFFSKNYLLHSFIHSSCLGKKQDECSSLGLTFHIRYSLFLSPQCDPSRQKMCWTRLFSSGFIFCFQGPSPGLCEDGAGGEVSPEEREGR